MFGAGFFGPNYWGPNFWATEVEAVTVTFQTAQPATEAISEVGICNSALQKIGLRRILSFAEEQATGVSEAQKVCGHQYPKLRDALLQMHHWNFAKKRKQLTATDTPAYEFDYAYALEDDWVRTIAVHHDTEGFGRILYRMEGRTVVTNTNECWMTYIRKVLDPQTMTADFRELLAVMLAREFAIPLADSLTLHDMMDELFRTEFARVASADAIEDYPEPMPESNWISARQGDLDDEEYWGW